ncbi:MAG: winged helix family transcriptional regulator [Proteobacteria bacterium]|nr:winged helix family transcriptional regulator [Pseudomonadota bacterium]
MRLDLDAGKATCLGCGQNDTLSPTETRLLRLLLEHRDRIVTRSEVIAKVWNGTKIAPRSLDAHISRLRKRIGFTGVVLESAYGDGYRLSTGAGCEAASGRMTASRGGSTGISRTAGKA